MFELTVLNQDYRLSQIFTKSCEYLNIAIKKFNKAVGATSRYCMARSHILAECNQWYVQYQNYLSLFWAALRSIWNIFAVAESLYAKIALNSQLTLLSVITPSHLTTQA